MTVDAWDDQQLSFNERAAAAVRSVVIAVFWMALIAGPPVVGGVLGWMTTRDAVSGPMSGLLGALPEQDPAVAISREEVEAVGLDPGEVRAILTE